MEARLKGAGRLPFGYSLAVVGRQRGFSLVEVLVATAIAFVVGWLLLRLTGGTMAAAARGSSRLAGGSAASRLSERLTAEAASAWSVFVPPADALGNDNADGHELDFAGEDAGHRQWCHAYAFDAATGRVAAYAYLPGGAAASGETFDGIASLHAKVFPIAALWNAGGELYDPLFAGSSASDVAYDFGWNPMAAGGNRLVRVALKADGANGELVLSSATAPTHFTVVIEYTPAP